MTIFQLEISSLFYSDEYPGKDIIVVDQRGAAEKGRFLSQLLKGGEKVLVFVNTLGRLHNLERIFLHREGIAFTHQGRFPGENEWDHFNSLVLYDLPLAGDRLAKLCTFLMGNNKGNRQLFVYLLYGPQDFRDNLTLLRATIPSFSSLEHVYTSLQELACAQSIPIKHLYGELRERLPSGVTAPLLKKSLEIFQEAAYLRLEKETIYLKAELEDDDHCYLLKTLAQTGSYRGEREKWEETLAWQQFFLNSPAEKILAFLTDFTGKGRE